jgi:hypothetical protein
VPLTRRSTMPYRRPLHTNGGIRFGALCASRGRERVAFMQLQNAWHSLSKPDISRCSGCLLSFTYQARQCPLSLRTLFSILRAELLEPQRSESCAWENRGLIQTHACAEAAPRWALCVELHKSLIYNAAAISQFSLRNTPRKQIYLA